MRFSKRNGYQKVREELQYEELDDDLKVRLWNAVDNIYFEGKRSKNYSDLPVPFEFFYRLYDEHLKLPVDDIESPKKEIDKIKGRIVAPIRWFDVYDLLEFFYNTYTGDEKSEEFKQRCNTLLEEEKSAYRLVDNKIIEITSEEEISEIEEAIEESKEYPNVETHLETALELLSDKEEPDYRNSIKESISAVEAMCQNITGEENTSLGQAIKSLEEKGICIPGSLKEAFSSLYGYSSAEDGIRHALKDKDEVKYGDAKFMLVVCSAFINYLKSKLS